MTQDQEKLFEDKLKDSLEKARIQGLGIGMKTATKVILDKVSKADRTYTKNDLLRVIKEVRAFCEIGLGMKNDTEDKA